MLSSASLGNHNFDIHYNNHLDKIKADVQKMQLEVSHIGGKIDSFECKLDKMIKLLEELKYTQATNFYDEL